MPNTIGVVFLARNADGPNALQRFANSYRQFNAGIEHELLVVYKGFKSKNELRQAQLLFADIPHKPVELPDVGFDIGAYLETSRRSSHEYLLFLNTHSEIVAPGWLTRLFQFASRDKVGATGAMGSYESIRDTVALLRKAIWRSIGVGRQYDRQLAYYFDFVLKQYHPTWYNPSGDVVPPSESVRGPSRKLVILGARALRYPWFTRKGTALIWPGAVAFNYRQFPSFPNPHIRSNGFMVRRDRFLQLGIPPNPTKIDTSLFESGPESMTSRLRKAGLATLVVGRNGEAYDVGDWWQSGTFRLGRQDNLLIADNHTRAFSDMSNGARVTHERTTWGDFLQAPPDDYPDLGVAFPNRLADLHKQVD